MEKVREDACVREREREKVSKHHSSPSRLNVKTHRQDNDKVSTIQMIVSCLRRRPQASGTIRRAPNTKHQSIDRKKKLTGGMGKIG